MFWVKSVVHTYYTSSAECAIRRGEIHAKERKQPKYPGKNIKSCKHENCIYSTCSISHTIPINFSHTIPYFRTANIFSRLASFSFCSFCLLLGLGGNAKIQTVCSMALERIFNAYIDLFCPPTLQPIPTELIQALCVVDPWSSWMELFHRHEKFNELPSCLYPSPI